jgi:hypothetical protein
MYVVKNSFINSEGSHQEEHNIKVCEGTFYYYLFIWQVSHLELFYLYQSEVGV